MVSAYFEYWDGRERRAMVLEGQRLTIGSAVDNDLVVDDRSVSRVHAVLHEMNGHWFIEDCGSRNGTSINAHPISSMRPLQPADEVRLGRALLVFRGQTSIGGPQTDAIIERPSITAREHDVLVALCRPLANGDVFTEPATVKEIAAELVVTENAVKLHLTNLSRKFGIDTSERRRSRLANAALDAGLITLNDLREDGGQ